jgi:acetyl esterase/lipase
VDDEPGAAEQGHEHHHARAHQIERWTLEGVLSIVSFAWAVLVIIVAMTVIWPDSTTKLPGVASLVRDTTAWALLIALMGIGLAGLTMWSGARLAGAGTLFIGVVGTIVVLWPVVGLASVAHEHDASISLFENLTKVANTGGPVPERSVTYATVGGEALALDVYVPGSSTAAPIPGAANAPRLPAVVWVHGGGWVSGTRGQSPEWYRLLNDQGYAVFDVDYRLATPTQPRWDQSAGDVLCAVGWVKAHAADYGIDPGRVALAGESAGGQLVLQAAYGTAGKPTVPSCPTPDASVRAVVSLYPGTEFTSLWASNSADGLMRPWVEAYQGGPPPSVPERYEASSPAKQVRPGAAPTMLLHGIEDGVVPVEQSESLGDVLTDIGVEHEDVILPLMDHAFDHSWHSLGTQIARDAVPRFLGQHTAPA